MKRSLKTQILLIMAITFVTSFIVLNIVQYQSTKNRVLNGLVNEARNVRNILMATRRVYHHQFLDSGIPLTDKNIGFLPAHALGKISKDFTNWTSSGLSFNNVSDRPRNPDNMADELELEAMAYFRVHIEAKERIVPFIDKQGQSYYHFSMPIFVETYCMQCHGEKENAPAAIQARYDSSYGYQLGDLRGLMSIKLPSHEIEATMWRDLFEIGAIYLATLLSCLLSIYLLLRSRIFKGLDELTESSSRVAQGDFNFTLPATGQNEFDKVLSAFNLMASSLQKRETEQQRLKKQLEVVLNKLDAIVYVADIASHELLFVNQYGIDAIGGEFHEGVKCWQYIQKEQSGSCDFCNSDRLLNSAGKPNEVVVWEFQNTQNQRWYECRDQAFQWVDGRMARLEVAVDITERKLVDKKQREQAAIWSSLMNSTSEGILGLDRQGLCTFCNPAGMLALGYRHLSDLQGRNMHHLIHYCYADGTPYPEHLCRMGLVMETRQADFVDGEVLWHADGHAIPVEYHATPITESGNNVVGAIITFEDISERLKTDKTLKQRIKELEQFNQLAVGRELKMVELKQEINQLLREQGEQEKYQVDE